MTIDVDGKLLEINLVGDNFLVVKETLSRIGIANWNEKILTQSCCIFHKQGKYYIVHFKEMFTLDGKASTFNDSDKNRRNMIATMLERWNLIRIVDKENQMKDLKFVKIDVVNHKEKRDWKLVGKYKIGKK